MESSLEKRMGKTYGPPNRKKLVFFFDDMNMPAPDKYGTQESIALLQQHVNYGFWYDRNKIGPPKEVVDLHYVGAMHPKSGTFSILDRLLRHFCVIATNMPDKSDLVKIYGQVFGARLVKFSREIRENIVPNLTNATIDLHAAMVRAFVPTAVKFHYQWNLREMFNIFQGLCKAHIKIHNDPISLVRLWLHECSRTFRDRLVDQTDMSRYDAIVSEMVPKLFSEIPAEELKEPILWGPFTTTKEGEEGVYDQTDHERCAK